MARLEDSNRVRQWDSKRAVRYRYFAVVLAAVLAAGCEPSDRTPGFWLRGDVAETFPQEWSFTDGHREIFVQVGTPYFVPHSVTIFCAQIDGKLFIAAREPETKKWVAWVENKRRVRLKIGDKLYDVATAEVFDEETLAAIRSAYAEKYDMTIPAGGEGPDFRFWSIVPRTREVPNG